jgi:hypothetical protein
VPQGLGRLGNERHTGHFCLDAVAGDGVARFSLTVLIRISQKVWSGKSCSNVRKRRDEDRPASESVWACAGLNGLSGESAITWWRSAVALGGPWSQMRS